MSDTTSTNHTTDSPAPHPATRLTVLISGSGTNLQALIDATTAHAPPPSSSSSSSSPTTLPNTTIIRVISNRKAAYGLTRASNAGIPIAYHNLVPYKTLYPSQQVAEAIPTVAPSATVPSTTAARAAYDQDLAALILSDSPPPDVVVCAGWMHILSPSFLDPLAAARIPVLNLHPALPGQFDGANAIERAWEAKRRGEVERTGVMVHYVAPEVDRGEAVLSQEIDLREGEDLHGLEQRIHVVEWKLLVQATGIVIRRLWKEREGETRRE